MDIDKIILKALNRKASQEEYEILEEWKAESEANMRYLNTLDLEHHGKVRYTHFDKQSGWASIKDRISSPSLSPVWYVLLAVVAALLITVAYNHYFKKEAYPRVHMAENQVRTFELPDQSVVHLNKGTTVTEMAPFEIERKIAIDGEAFFDIAHDPANPFVIELDGNDQVRVLGTSFNLLNSENSFDLAVFSGKVELNTLNRKIILEKNERMIKLDGAYVRIQNIDPNLVSWKDNTLVFNSTPITEVMEDVSQHFDFRYDMAQGLSTSDCTLTSRFEKQTAEEVIDEMSKIFDMEYRFHNDTLKILSLNCK